MNVIAQSFIAIHSGIAEIFFYPLSPASSVATKTVKWNNVEAECQKKVIYKNNKFKY